MPRGTLSSDKKWTELLDLAIFFFKPLLRQVDIFHVIRATQRTIAIPNQSMLGVFQPSSKTCFIPVGELGFSLFDMKMVTSFPFLVMFMKNTSL